MSERETTPAFEDLLKVLTPPLDAYGHAPGCGYTDEGQVCGCLELGRRLRKWLSDHDADIWPCDNYKAPLTCLTAPSSEAARCDFCRAQAEAVGRVALRDAARFIEEDMADAWGGDASWLTTGNRVAKIAAATLRSLASPTDRDG